MTTRTFRQLGIAFGSQTANITAKINNVVVYQGPVTTLNQPFPVLPNLDYTVTNVLFSWTNDVTYTGPAIVEIQVDADSDLLVAEISANYTPFRDPANVQSIISSGPDGFIDLPVSQIGNIYVDGSLRPVDHTNPLVGQYWWELIVPDTIEINATIKPGFV
jgi:hypothetical protein